MSQMVIGDMKCFTPAVPTANLIKFINTNLLLILLKGIGKLNRM